MWQYRREGSLWAVGFRDTVTGAWVSVYLHTTAELAAAHAAWLSGGVASREDT
jgi:hypothetical protein